MSEVSPEVDLAQGGERAAVRVGKYRLPLPRTRAVRIALGIALVLGGMLFFLPVLGLWMLPLGLLVLSGEFVTVRRWRRKLVLWWGHRRRGPAKEK